MSKGGTISKVGEDWVDETSNKGSFDDMTRSIRSASEGTFKTTLMHVSKESIFFSTLLQ